MSPGAVESEVWVASTIDLPAGFTGFVNLHAVAVDSGGNPTVDPAPISLSGDNPAVGEISDHGGGSGTCLILGPGTVTVTASDGAFSDTLTLVAPPPPPNPVAGIVLTRA